MEPLTEDEIKDAEISIKELDEEYAAIVADYFDQRELRLVRNCIEYADEDPAGLPGHALMLLVAKMARFQAWTASFDWLDNVIDSLEK